MSVSDENQKLGRIPNFSLVPGLTCLGCTIACAGNLRGISDYSEFLVALKSFGGYCYAVKAYRQYPEVRNSWDQNTFASPDYRIAMIREYLRHSRTRVFRIHPAGEFDSIAYIKAWMELVIEFPQVQFVCYSRVWRLTSMRRPLERLALLANVNVYASEDYPGEYSGPLMVAAASDDAAPGYYVCPGSAGGTVKCKACMACYRSHPVKKVRFALH